MLYYNFSVARSMLDEEFVSSFVQELKDAQVIYPDWLPKDKYCLSPHLPRSKWKELGALVIAAEKDSASFKDLRAANSKWLVLRLDGCGFGKLVKSCRRLKVFPEKGHARCMAEIMEECSRSLIRRFPASFVYTHSDEITMAIPPPDASLGNSHPYNGRIMKLCSIASSVVTFTFTTSIIDRFRSKGISLGCMFEELPEILFDCRIGSYSREAGLSVFLWRYASCSTNCLSDAVYYCIGDKDKADAAQMMRKDSIQKLQWLLKHDLLPLSPRQEHGSFLCKIEKELEGFNPKTQEKVKYTRKVIAARSCNIISEFIAGTLLPSSVYTPGDASAKKSFRNQPRENRRKEKRPRKFS